MDAVTSSTQDSPPTALLQARIGLSALRRELGGTSSLFAASRVAVRGAALAEGCGVALRKQVQWVLSQSGGLSDAAAQRAARLVDKSAALLAAGLRLRAIARELRTPLEAELGLRGAQALVEQGMALVGS